MIKIRPASVENSTSADEEDCILESSIAVVDTVVVSGPTTQITYVLRPSLSIGHLGEGLRLNKLQMSGVVNSVQLLFEFNQKNTVFEELRVKRLAMTQEEICGKVMHQLYKAGRP